MDGELAARMMLLLAVSLALQSATEPEPPVSMDRIRARLAAPAPLQIALPEPTVEFRIVIHEHPYWIDEPLGSNFKVPPMTQLAAPAAFGSPEWFASQSAAAGGGVDMLSLIAHVRHTIQARSARKDVQRAMAEFCATNSCR
jgi:hypothetical protein